MADDLAVIVFGYQAHVGYSRFTQTVHEERFVEAIEGQLVDLAYSIKVMRLFRSSLERQIWESIFIDEEDPEVRLKSRSEWGANKVPRLIIDPESRYKQGEQDQDKDQGHQEEALLQRDRC